MNRAANATPTTAITTPYRNVGSSRQQTLNDVLWSPCSSNPATRSFVTPLATSDDEACCLLSGKAETSS
jgi:hypothetical protein